MNRRNFLSVLACLPGFGWLKPKPHIDPADIDRLFDAHNQFMRKRLGIICLMDYRDEKRWFASYLPGTEIVSTSIHQIRGWKLVKFRSRWIREVGESQQVPFYELTIDGHLIECGPPEPRWDEKGIMIFGERT